MILNLIFFFFLFLSLPSHAQKNGVSGYGHAELVYVLGNLSKDVYIGAGGGVVLNDNFQFGVFLRALNRPYRFNLLTSTFPTFDDNKHPFSNNENAVSTIANHTETGFNTGFNIMPDKPFQITFNGRVGLSIVSFSEITVLQDTSNLTDVVFTDEFYTMFGGNASLEINLQVKVGGSMKMGVKGGYHLAIINGQTRDGNLLKVPTMFSGPYIGASLVFGSF